MSGFKQKTIKSIIRDKLNKLIASVRDEELQKLMKRDILVTGGCIASMELGEKVNDYDVYFKTKETAFQAAVYYTKVFCEEKARLHAVAGLAEDEVAYEPIVKIEKARNIDGVEEDRVLIFMKSAGVAGLEQKPYEYFETRAPEAADAFMASLETEINPDEDEGDVQPSHEDGGLSLVDGQGPEFVEGVTDIVTKAKNLYMPLFLTDNAITMTDKVQIIIRFYGTAEEIHKNYDFVHCQGVYDYATNQLYLSEDTLKSLLSKQLIYNGSLYPIASVLRLRKFIKRGWNISAGQVLKILHQISKVDWNNPDQLREQLMGVDVAYMHQLIGALNSRDSGQRIDQAYLAGLLDTIFDD